MAGLSIWWPTPASPEAHFSAEELTRSAAYHRPLRLVGAAGVTARLGLLVASGLLADDIGRWLGIERQTTGEQGWVEAVTAGSVWLGAALTVVALRVPAILVDGWFEYRFRRGIDGYRPLPPVSFGATILGLAALSWVLLAVVAGTGYRVAAVNAAWPAVFIAAVVLVIGVMAVGERPLRRLLPGRERALEGHSPVGGELAELAARFDLAPVSFHVGQPPGTAEPPARTGAGAAATSSRAIGSGANACAMGLGGNRRVVVTDALLSEDRATRDFVVAHELTHLARRHLALQTAVAVAGYASVIGALALLVETGRPWSWFDLAPLDPLGLPVLGLVVIALGALLGPVTAWISRVQERSADAGAIAVVGPLLVAAAGGLYVDTTADLDPPRWAKLYAEHPAPAERLEFLSRHRRSEANLLEPAAVESAARGPDAVRPGTA